MRYKVPQNIDMQDRIIGSLTMVQFIYAIIGFGLCYSIFMTIPKPYSYFLLIPTAALTVAIVFIKVNERPFLNFMLSAIDFLSRPKKRVWHHQQTDNLKVIIYKAAKNQQYRQKQVSREQMEELASRLDTGEKNRTR